MKLPGTSGLFKKSQIFRKKFCPGQRSCPGQVASSKGSQFSARSSAPGSEAARDTWLLIKTTGFLEKVLPQAAKLPGTSGFYKKKSIFCQKFCPRQRSCPGQVASSKGSQVSAKSSAPGSEAAQDKWLVQKKTHFLRTSSAPGSEAAQDKWRPKKIALLEKVLPQAAKLPGTSGFFQKKLIF